MSNFDSGVREALRERAIGAGDEHLLHTLPGEAANQKLGLAFTTTVSTRQTDVSNSHGH